MKFTTESLMSLEPRDKKYTLRDDSTPGFMVQVLPSGTRTLYHESVRGGRKVRRRLGRLPEADVEAARAHCAERNARPKGVAARAETATQEPPEPLSAQIKVEGKLAELMVAFDRFHVARLAPSTQIQYRDLLRLAALDFETTSELQPKAIREVMDAMADTPTKANRYLAVLSVFCGYLVERGWLDYNPAMGMKKYKEEARDRHLRENELRPFGEALNASLANPSVILAIKIILSTGVRVGECVGMRQKELDGSGEWLLGKERTKAGREFLTLLPLELSAVLRRRVDPPLTGTSGPLTAGAVNQALGRICEQAGVTKVSPHDLRRTFGTILARRGYTGELRARLLNHAASGVTDRHYNVYDYLEEKKSALRDVHKYLAEVGIL